MKSRVVALVVLVAAVSACSSTRPVSGRMEASDETFGGTVTGSGYREGMGELVLRSNRPATCRGSFVYTSRRRAEGTLTCDDGRRGTFRIAAVDNVGNGTGELGGKRFTFTFAE